MLQAYRGDTPAKRVNRALFWAHVYQTLGRAQFTTRSHFFLASRFGSDIDILRAFGVDDSLMGACEMDRAEYDGLIDRLRTIRYEGRRWNLNVIAPVARFGHTLGSLYLDFKGHAASHSTHETLVSCASHLLPGSVLGITVSAAREADMRWTDIQQREDHVTNLIARLYPGTRPSLMIQYQSRDEQTRGSKMLTLAYHLGNSDRKTKRINLISMSPTDQTNEVRRTLSRLKLRFTF